MYAEGFFSNLCQTQDLKVVGNEKEGGPGKWQVIDIYLGLWWSMSICLCIQPPSCFKSISFSAYSSPIIKRWPTD
jgi:hypothetical protein